MKITYHTYFKKLYKKQSQKIQKKIDKSLKLFKEDISHPQLKNHILHGKFKGCRSINAGGDIRLIFREKDTYIEVLFVDLGTHSELY